MSSERPPSLRSEREGDPSVDERIDAFVARLGETVDLFQDTESSGDWIRLRTLALDLAAEAGMLGYPPLVDAAQGVARACGERDPEVIRKSVVDLTEISQRVRRGHRSAA